MTQRASSARRAAWLAVAAALLVACDAAPTDGSPDGSAPAAALPAPRLGLMTSLPLYWPATAGIADLAAGQAAPPWQRAAIENHYAIVPLDTLSPIAVPGDDAAPLDPLAGLERLAVIQPRGLSPADNVALDQWVRAGGRLLLVLDPALTGEYAAPLGDSRRPVDSAPIPPVVARWGLAVQFDPDQPARIIEADLAGARLPLALPGQVIARGPSEGCTLLAKGAAARCTIGRGQITLIADAALFEHRDIAGEDGAVLAALLAATFD